MGSLGVEGKNSVIYCKKSAKANTPNDLGSKNLPY
jgi:hypothetical protein